MKVFASNGVVKKIRSRITRLSTSSNWNLLVELIRANFKVTDHNSILGVFWSLISPVTMLLVLYFLFKARLGQNIYAYPLYLLIGIITVTFFVAATSYLAKIFLLNRRIILNSTVPREDLVISHIFVHAYKFTIELVFCFALSIFYNVFTWKGVFLILPLLFAYLVFVLGIGLIISLANCFIRDTEHIWMLVSRLFFFATPIFYSLDKVSPWAYRLIYWFNPLTPFLISFRNVIMGGGDMDMFVYMHSLLLGISFFAMGYCLFIMLENVAMEKA
jgi:ABC-type polysaccharide/polyol phosphate export permease